MTIVSPVRADSPQAKPATETTKGPPAPSEDPPHLYQGAYWGLQAHVGFVHRLMAHADDLPGPAVGVSARLASYMSLADFQLTLQGSMYDATTSTGEQVGVKRLSVGAEVHLHPLFLNHLENSTFWYWAAGIYISVGADVDITWVEGAGKGAALSPGFTVGGGMDYPLTDVHAGWSLWLGASYKIRITGASTGVPGLTNFNEHTVLITLGYRNNDIFGFRAPRPSELDYRDPELPEK